MGGRRHGFQITRGYVVKAGTRLPGKHLQDLQLQRLVAHGLVCKVDKIDWPLLRRGRSLAIIGRRERNTDCCHAISPS
jgi:hypothetical protein